jgi:hypothetical protein
MHLPIQPLSVSSKETSQLWAKGVTSAFSAVVPGLPEPEPSTWKALVSSSAGAVRSKPRTSDGLSVLATRDLWTAPEPEVNDVASSMWNSRGKLEKLSSQAPTSGVNSPSSIWSPPVKQTEVRSHGLFSTLTEDTVIRTTQAVPAAINMAKAPQQMTNTIPKISSQNMWTRIENLENATKWVSKSSALKNRHAVACSPALWAPPAESATDVVFSIFNVSTPRSHYRTSYLPPAAINMVCTPRKVLKPLSELTSSRLWNGCKKLPIEHHWISESSVRPESPSVYSTTSSGSSSPASDSSSLKSTSTKASSVWGFVGSVAPASASTWWEGKNAKKPAPTPLDDESKYTSKIRVRQPSLNHLAPLRESRVLASRDLWESRAPVLDTPAKKFRKGAAAELEAAPIIKPIRHQYRSNVTSRAGLDEVLAQAILAGIPKKPLTQPFASTADWETTLAEAVSHGHVAKSSKYDPSVMHPVFFTESCFVSGGIDVHPAAIGYVTKSKRYDSSVLHPVFFTERLSSNASDIHPAALGHLANENANFGMWTGSLSPSVSEYSPLWSKNAPKTRDSSAYIVERNGQTVRKALQMKPLNLPALQSTTTWQPPKAAQEQRLWLTASVQSWVPHVSSAPQSNANSSSWTVPAALDIPSTPDMSALIQVGHIKQSPSRPAALQTLNTNAMFAKTNAQSSVTHWLHKTSAADSTVKWSTIWTAPPPKQLAKTEHMWNAGPEFDPTSASLFSNPHTQWNRKRRENASLRKIESTEMWRQPYSLPKSPKNWLVNRRVSKVEFRY